MLNNRVQFNEMIEEVGGWATEDGNFFLSLHLRDTMSKG